MNNFIKPIVIIIVLIIGLPLAFFYNKDSGTNNGIAILGFIILVLLTIPFNKKKSKSAKDLKPTLDNKGEQNESTKFANELLDINLKIKSLEESFDLKILTEEEYNIKKEKLLNSLSVIQENIEQQDKIIKENKLNSLAERSLFKELSKLRELRDLKIISDLEYEKRKTELIESKKQQLIIKDSIAKKPNKKSTNLILGLIVLVLTSALIILILNKNKDVNKNEYELSIDIQNWKNFSIVNKGPLKYHKIDTSRIIANHSKNELFRINEPYRFQISIPNIPDNRVTIKSNYSFTKYGGRNYVFTSNSNKELFIEVSGKIENDSIIYFSRKYKILDPPENSTVLYRGVVNILSVNVRGVPNNLIRVSQNSPNYGVQKHDRGEYIITPTKGDSIIFDVDAKLSDGSVISYSKKFRIIDSQVK